MAANLGQLAYYALMTFMANLTFSAMGIGMATIFIFWYQVGVLANWIEDDLKYGIFVQTLALFIIQPIVLGSVNLKNHARLDLLVPFILVQFVGTPIGLWLQDHTPVPIMKMIIGILTLLVSMKQMHTIRKNYIMSNSKDENKAIAKPNVYFMIGCQRSGSNWLQLMISKKYSWIASPHPPHIIDTFKPILKNFGDLSKPDNFECLIKAVIEYIDANPVPWTDYEGNKLIMTPSMVTKKCGTKSLVGIFEAVMDLYAESNNCSTWICKSMKTSLYSKELEEHFGGRLKYIYLHRNPKDVCISFKKAPIGNCHFYKIAENWSKLQQVALTLSKSIGPDRFTSISYESLLNDKEGCLDAIGQFIGVAPDGITNQAYQQEKNDKEAIERAKQSSLWKNLTRGDSLVTEKLEKLQLLDINLSNSNELTELDHTHIEAACFDQMVELGYKPFHEVRPQVSQIDLEQFHKENEIGKQQKKAQLKIDDPKDWSNRQQQETILKKFSDTFVTIEDIAINDKQNQWNLTVLKQQFWPIRPIFLVMLCTGFLDGFLGGLVGLRGPPFIIFFLVFEYPNPIIKANGTVIATVNTFIRIVSYTFKTPPPSYVFDTWFTIKDLNMYLAVALAGLVACKIGLSMTKYITKWTYKAILAGFLVIMGITMITTAALDF